MFHIILTHGIRYRPAEPNAVRSPDHVTGSVVGNLRAFGNLVTAQPHLEIKPKNLPNLTHRQPPICHGHQSPPKKHLSFGSLVTLCGVPGVWLPARFNSESKPLPRNGWTNLVGICTQPGDGCTTLKQDVSFSFSLPETAHEDSPCKCRCS